MPRTLSFPPPSATRCPICATDIEEPACPRCGAVFTTEDGSTLWRVDHDLFDLCRIRNDVVRRLLATAEVARASRPGPSRSEALGQRIASESTADTSGTGSWAAPAPADRLTPGGQRIASESTSDSQRIAGESTSDDQRIAGESTSDAAETTVWSAPVTEPVPATPHGQRIVSESTSDAVEATVWSAPVPGPAAPAWSRPPTAPSSPADTGAPWWAPRPGAAGPAGPVPPATAPSDPPRPPRPRLTIAEVLVGLGGLSLVAAVIVFAAVTWNDLAAWAQGGLIVVASTVVLALAAVARRRDLTATAESLGAVGVALALADVHVARVGLATPGRPTWAVGLAVAAAGLVGFGAWTKVRTTALAGCALALVPVPLVLVDAGLLPLAAGLAAQAVVATLVATRLDDRPLERTIVQLGTVMSWIGAVAIALTVAGGDLVDEPARSPLAAAAVLAGLALGSIAVGRVADRSELAPVLSGGGIVLAFVPAPLLAAATGSGTLLAASVVAQAVVAGAALTTERLRPVERATLGASTALVGGAAVLASLGLVASALAGDEVPTAGAALLGALAAAWVAAGRRREDEVVALGGAGTALALLPAPLLALGGERPDVVAAVVAAEGLAALAMAGDARLRTVERGVLGALAPAALLLGVGGAAVIAVQAVAAGSVADRVVPIATLAVVAVGLLGVGRSAERGQAAVAGAALALAPAPLAVAGLGSTALLTWVLMAQAAVVAVVAARARGPQRDVLQGGAIATWAASFTAATTMGVAGWAGAATQGPAGSIAALVALSVLAGVASVRSGWGRDAVSAGLGAAALPLVVAAGLAAGGTGADGRAAAVLAGCAAVGVGAALLRRVDAEQPWLVPQVVSLVIGGVAALVPLTGTLAVGSLIVDRSVAAPGVGADVTMADWLRPALERTSVAALPGWATVGQLAAFAVLAGVLAAWQRRAGGAAGLLVVVAGLVVVPVVAGLTVAATIVGLAVVLVAAAEAVRRQPSWPEPVVLLAVVGGLGLAVARASEPAVVVWTGLAAALLIALTALRARAVDAATPIWTAAAGAAVLAAVGLDADVLGATTEQTALAFAVTAVALAAVARPLELAALVARPARSSGDAAGWDPPVAHPFDDAAGWDPSRSARSSDDAASWDPPVAHTSDNTVSWDPSRSARPSDDAASWDPSRPARWSDDAAGWDQPVAPWTDPAPVAPRSARDSGRQSAAVVDGVVALAAAWAIAIRPSAPILSAVLALAAVAATVTALRPTRRPLAFLAGALAVVSLWVQLGHAGVVLVEAYALPLAAGALAVGLVVGRGRGSWERFGAALVVGLGPSTVLALVDPGATRAVAVVVAAGALVVLGAVRRLQAPLAVGGVAVAAVAVRHLLPVATEVPRSAALAAVGLLLLGVGATFEQRRQDLRQARDSFGRLG